MLRAEGVPDAKLFWLKYTMNTRHNNGFTLIEVIIVAVIISVLAAVSIPLYNGYVTDSRIRAAKSTCQLVAAAALQAHNKGISIEGSDVWDDIGIRDPSDETWDYSIAEYPAGPVDEDFEVTAEGVEDGPMDDEEIIYRPYRDKNDGRWEYD